MMAKEWGVAPWDLVQPESKGHECWLVWMRWAGQLMAHAGTIAKARQSQQEAIKRATGQR